MACRLSRLVVTKCQRDCLDHLVVHRELKKKTLRFAYVSPFANYVCGAGNVDQLE